MPEQYRGFFWVRLKLKGSDITIFIATAHFTQQEYLKEFETGFTPRNNQIHQTIKCLKKLVKNNEPAFFMGDLNDPVLSEYFLSKEGYNSCFQDLNLLSPPTHPTLPMIDVQGHNKTIDYIFCNRKQKQYLPLYRSFISNIWPVHTIYQL